MSDGGWTPEAIAAEEAYRQTFLDRGVCPDSGERLTIRGDGPAGSLSCAMCDCFGYPIPGLFARDLKLAVPVPQDRCGLVDLNWRAVATDIDASFLVAWNALSRAVYLADTIYLEHFRGLTKVDVAF